jgi:hypothetical protein
MRWLITVAVLVTTSLFAAAPADAFHHGRGPRGPGRYQGYGNAWGGYRGYNYGSNSGFSYGEVVGQPGHRHEAKDIRLP